MSQDDFTNQLADARADGSALERAEGLLVAQGRLLEMAALGRSLSEIFAELTEAVSRLAPAARAGVFLASADRTQMADFHSVCMAASFGAGVQGAPINDPAAGACGAAMLQRRAITCIDIAGSEEWTRPWRQLCATHGVRACHSIPIRLPGGPVAGSFLMCFAEARAPSAWELRLAEFGAHLAGVALERDRAGEARREGERRFRELVDGLPAAIYTTDAEGRITYFNPAAVDFSGRTPEIGSDQWCVTWKMFRPDGTPLPHCECPMAIALKEGRPVRGEEAVAERPDGARLWFEAFPSPILDSDGQIVGGVNMLVDVTERKLVEAERKQAEDELRRHGERFKCLLHNAPLGMYLIDADFRIREVNPTALPALGDVPGGLIGRDFEEIMRLVWQKEHADKTIGIFRHTLETGEPYHAAEVSDFRIDRNVTEHYEWRVDRIALPEGRHGLVCYFRDISRQVQYAQALEDADRRKDEFLATLSHELRNPLAPIRNSLHILRMAGGEGGAAERMHEIMERQINHMVRLVDDLMEISRITRGKIELRKERVELAGIVRGAVETSKPLIESARHQLAIALPPEPLMLDADPVRLVQVLANLLNNAAKYTEPAGQIWLTVQRDHGQAVICVRDTGIGIRPDDLGNVFDLFTQADGAYDRAQGGLGIGLTLVRSLVEMHGGSVEAKSDGKGKGSEFVVHLPLALGKPGRSDDGAGDGWQESVAACRILVVDDNCDAADTLGMLLTFLGADVRTVHDGPEALAALETYRPSVILLDIGMPVMDGFELARRIRQRPEGQSVALIALTGWGQEEDRRRSREAGIDHHLVKPVDLNALQTLLASLAGDDSPRRGELTCEPHAYDDANPTR